jgi:ribonuclease D
LERLVPTLKARSKNICDLQIAQSNTTAGGGQTNIGLSESIEKYFQLRLDKTEQCSNWCKRPLRKSQLLYAALDAVVLIDLACAMKYGGLFE